MSVENVLRWMRGTDAHVYIKRLNNGKFWIRFGPPDFCMAFEEESLEKGLLYGEKHFQYLHDETEELFRKATFVRDYFVARSVKTHIDLRDLLPLGDNGHIRVDADLTVETAEAKRLFSVHLAGLYTEEELRLLAFVAAYSFIVREAKDLTDQERTADMEARKKWITTVETFNKQ